jgi:acetyltransferase-like isoleucine patch superfamily enzyme
LISIQRFVMRSRALRHGLALVAMLAPSAVRLGIYRRLFGYRIAPTAVVGRSFIVVDELEMAAGAVIGALNLLRGCRRVQLAENAYIGALNWVNGVQREGAYAGLVRDPSLYMGRESNITSLHMLDCSDAIEIGEFCTLAGCFTQVLTHSVDLADARQHTAPVRTGPYSFIGNRCTILAGSVIAERVVVGVGSVVHRSLPEKRMLYAGNPAKPIKELPEDTGWFTRTSGWIH